MASRRRRHSSPVPGSIPAALDELGIAHTARGDEIIMLCPYHDDHRAGSFSVKLDTGQNYCFSCDKGGGFDRIVQVVLKLDPFTAARWCRERAFETDVAFGHEELEYDSGKIDTSEQVNEASLVLYTAPPPDALSSRQIDAETAAAFGLLWDKGTWIIPVRDPLSGALWGWQAKRDKFFRNYPPGIPKSRTLFGLGCFRDGDIAVLVESPLDTVRLASAGVPGALSSYGVGVSDEQLAIIRQRASGLVLALDNDMPGMSKTIDILRSERRMDIQVFNYGAQPEAKDPGEMTSAACRWGMINAFLRTEVLEFVT